MRPKIITDSTSDLPQELVHKHDIEVMPLGVTIDEEEFLDGVTIKPKDVAAAIRAGKLPTTSQVTQERFRDTMSEYAEKGQPCVYIAFSSRMSGTCQTGAMVLSQLAEEHPEWQAAVIDSRCGSLGQGLVVLKAAEQAAQDKPLAQIIEAVKQCASHMQHLFTVDDLHYLSRGGRVSQVSAIFGSLLNIKPVLHLADGQLIPIDKVRGTIKAYERIIALMKQRGLALKEQTIGISHANDPDAAARLEDLIRKELGCTEILINEIGGVIGAHIGVGGVAAFFQGRQPNNPEIAVTTRGL